MLLKNFTTYTYGEILKNMISGLQDNMALIDFLKITKQEKHLTY